MSEELEGPEEIIVEDSEDFTIRIWWVNPYEPELDEETEA